MESLRVAFDWETPTDLGERMRRGHVLAMARRLGPSVAEATVAQLDDESLCRILGAPALVRLLHQHEELGAARVLQTLERWCRAEQMPGSTEPERTLWTALGDRRWEEDRITERAPIVAGLVIDGSSPEVEHGLPTAAYRPVQFGAPAYLSKTQVGETVKKLRDTLGALEQLCPNAASFVSSAAATVVLVRDDTHPTLFTSASQRLVVGRISLVNPHLAHVDTARLASALVHEAVHAALYVREYELPFVRPPRFESEEQPLVESPWTGARLRLSTFVHACFVWHALERLWAQPGAEAIFGVEPVRRERARMSGVEVLDVDALVGDAMPWLSEQGRAQLRDLYRRLSPARERVRGGEDAAQAVR